MKFRHLTGLKRIFADLFLAVIVLALVSAALSGKAYANQASAQEALRIVSQYLPAIEDDEPSTISIDDPAPVTEGGTIVFTVSVEPVNENDTIMVDYTTVDGSALAGSDFNAVSGVLEIPPNNASATITVVTLDDPTDEDNETFTVELSNPINAELDPDHSIGTGEIIDNDDPPDLSINSPAAVVEGNSILFTVSLSEKSSKTISVDYSTVDGSALAGSDFIAVSDTLVIPPNTASETITVVTLDDPYDEEDEETFTVELSNPDNAELDPDHSIGTGAILDNDPPPVLSIDDQTVLEGNIGTKDMIFTVSLNQQSQRQVTIRFRISTTGIPDDEKATEFVDFFVVGSVSQLIFAPGVIEKTITVRVIGDTLDEKDEYFYIELYDATNATISETNGKGKGTIEDDDGPQISIHDVTIPEGDNTHTINVAVRISAASIQDIEVDYLTEDGSAIAGVDYEAAAGTITIPSGELEANIQVTIYGNTNIEDDKNFFIQLSNAKKATIARDRAKVTLENDDNLKEIYLPLIIKTLPPIEMIVQPASGLLTSERGGQATFRVKLSGEPLAVVTIDVSSLDESEGVAAPAQLSFNTSNWNTEQVVTITGVNDSLVDGDIQYEIEIKASSTDIRINGSTKKVMALNKDDDVFADNFSTDKGWETVPETGATWIVNLGEYFLKHITQDRNVRTVAPFLAANMPAAYSVEVKARITNGAHSLTSYGILFDWLDNLRFYRFLVKPATQQWWVFKFQNGWVTLSTGTNAAIRTGTQTNLLRVDREGNSIKVYAENTLLWSGTDSTYANGRGGLTILANSTMSAGQYAEAAFDDFVISNLYP
jgi:hypothetical protein